jgi:nicotinamidase-related amidase
LKGGNGAALIVIDMLNDFVLPGAPLEVPAARRIIPAVRTWIKSAREQGTLVIYMCDAHAEEDAEFEVWGRHAVQGSKGAEVIEELAPGADDIVLAKTTLSAFYKTQLEDTLRQKGITKVTLVGILTNICVFFAAFGAAVRGFEITVPRDCVAALDEQEHEFALGQMEKVLGVNVM